MAGRTFCGYNRTSATKEIPITRTLNCFFVCIGIQLAACKAPDSPPPPLAPREVVTLGKWRVESEGHVLGQVVKLEIRDPAGPVRFFRIEDRFGRYVGDATENGRFTRRRPEFLGGDEDLGVWSLQRGVGMLFEAASSVHLQSIPVEADWQKER